MKPSNISLPSSLLIVMCALRKIVEGDGLGGDGGEMSHRVVREVIVRVTLSSEAGKRWWRCSVAGVERERERERMGENSRAAVFAGWSQVVEAIGGAGVGPGHVSPRLE